MATDACHPFVSNAALNASIAEGLIPTLPRLAPQFLSRQPVRKIAQTTPMPMAPNSARAFWAMAGMALAMLGPLLAAAALEVRVLEGANLWIKPAKFALFFVVLFVTMAMVAEGMSVARREGWVMRGVLTAMTAGFVVEMVAISGQAGRGVLSHFNDATEAVMAIDAVMGLGSLALVSGIAAMGWVAARDVGTRMGPGLRAGVGVGLSARRY